MVLSSSETEGFDRVAVALVARPGGAPLALRLDGGPPRPISTVASQPARRRVEVMLPARARAHRVELSAPRAAGQQILGWAVERRGPGIIYENHGSIGATAALIEKLDRATVASELAERRPALLVVAFGTNEGFDESLDLARYAARFRAAVGELARVARGAAILVLGPPDGNRLPPGLSRKDVRRPAAAVTAPAPGPSRAISRRFATSSDARRSGTAGPSGTGRRRWAAAAASIAGSAMTRPWRWRGYRSGSLTGCMTSTEAGPHRPGAGGRRRPNWQTRKGRWWGPTGPAAVAGNAARRCADTGLSTCGCDASVNHVFRKNKDKC